MASVFKDEEFYLPAEPAYSLLPFRFIRLDLGRYIAVNEVGESQVLLRDELELLVKKRLPRTSHLYYALKASNFLEDNDSDIAPDLLTLNGLNTQITAAVANAWEEARKLGYDAYKQKLIAKGTSLRHFRKTILAVAAWIVLISGG